MESVKVVPYFGSVEKPECHLLYNVTTMCTTWHTVATRDTRLLRRQPDAVNTLPKEYVFLNYLRCHDDIGWGLDYEWLNRNFGIDEVLHKRYLNDYFQGFADNSASRYLHRGRMKWELSEHKDDLETPEGKMFCGLSALIGLRGACPAFGTAADVWTLDTGDDGLLAIGRGLSAAESACPGLWLLLSGTKERRK